MLNSLNVVRFLGILFASLCRSSSTPSTSVSRAFHRVQLRDNETLFCQAKLTHASLLSVVRMVQVMMLQQGGRRK